jgi:hypothetical protein
MQILNKNIINFDLKENIKWEIWTDFEFILIKYLKYSKFIQ